MQGFVPHVAQPRPISDLPPFFPFPMLLIWWFDAFVQSQLRNYLELTNERMNDARLALLAFAEYNGYNPKQCDWLIRRNTPRVASCTTT